MDTDKNEIKNADKNEIKNADQNAPTEFHSDSIIGKQYM